MKAFLQLTGFLYFLILNLFCSNPIFAQIQTGKSYINVSKNVTGGTFEPGDTLEIRACISIGSTTPSITQVRYNDTINSNFTYLTGSLKIITNEGLTFRSYTDAGSDDAAMFNTANNTLRVNLGKTATAATNTLTATTGGGTILYTDKPSFNKVVCIMVVAFRVQINPTLAYNTLINLPGGAFRYTQSSGVVATFASYNIMLFKNVGVCPNYVGGNAVIENNGSFGSGTTRNRTASAIVPGYTFTNFTANSPNDGSYGIANNTSAAGSTNNGVAYPNSARVFNLWDIIGDHTGAADPYAGNAATAVGSNGGYMAVINATYATSQAIQQSIANLCPATYYDFSAWFRNICSKCSYDSNGNAATNVLFNGPYAPGVKPNLTFQIDGVDYYTTGDIPYDAKWTKKGFTYLTGAAQTAFTLSIRNNSPGGGGNDWAIDDINLSTCVPDLLLKYDPQILVCKGGLIDLSATIKCYFSNYTYYKWQKSTDGGTTWANTGVSGTGSPTLVSGQWEYSTPYPPFIATMADSGNLYRIVVATTASNLTNTNCAYSNNASTFVKVINCGVILNVNLKSFSGEVQQSSAALKWLATTGNDIQKFEVEKSTNGISFTRCGTVNANGGATLALYQFTDQEKLQAPTFYRLKLIEKNNLFSYSSVILLSNTAIDFEINAITNPVTGTCTVSYTLPKESKVTFTVLDVLGHFIKQQQVQGKKGWNQNELDAVNNLSNGVYLLSVSNGDKIINKRIIVMK